MQNENNRNDNNIHHLYSVSAIALMMLEDIELLHERLINRHDEGTIQTGFTELGGISGFIKPGELLVVAIRSEPLRKEFMLQISQYVAFVLKHDVLIYSGNESLVRFTRKLVDHISGISSEARIYDGELKDVDFMRLANTLVKLSHTKIIVNQCRFTLEDICASTLKCQQNIAGTGMVVVDYTQQIMDGNYQLNEPQHSLVRLKKLARDLGVPVVAIYQLDPAEEKHPSTLTRFELAEVESLAAVPDEILLMSGTPEYLVFEVPKILRNNRCGTAL